MKILNVTSSGYAEGGVENGIIMLDPVLRSLGHEVRTVACDKRMDLPRFAQYTYKGIPQDGLSKYVRRAVNWDAVKTVRAAMRDFQPDLVVLKLMGDVSPAVLLALRSVPTIVHLHGPEEYAKGLLMWAMPTSDFTDGSHEKSKLTPAGRLKLGYIQAISRPLYRLGFHNVDGVITVSEYMRQMLIEGDNIQSVVVPNGIKLMPYSPQARSNPTILYSGRLEKYKGVDDLIRSLPAVKISVSDAELLIAGAGVYRPELEQLAKDLHVESAVSFLGHQSREGMEDLMARAKIVAMPSVWPEAFGKAALEGLSAGCPVVVSDVGGVRDWMVDGEVGFLAPPSQPAQLADALVRILTDDAVWASMSKVGRARAEQFSIEAHAQKIVAAYQDVLAEAQLRHHRAR